MAISGLGCYVNTYENLNVSKQTKTSETDGISEVKTEAAKKSSSEEYLKSLQKQVPYIKLQTGYGLNANKDGKVNIVDVNPKLLEKMQNNPEAAKEYTKRLKDIESATKWVDGWEKAMGYKAIVRHGYVDENGNFSSFAVVVRKDELNERLRKEAQENAEKQIEKTRENARKKVEQLEEKAEEAKDSEKKPEKLEEKKVVKEDETTTTNKAKQLLGEKIASSKDGTIYLYDMDMKKIMEAMKADNTGKTDTKEQTQVGANLDMKI